MLGHAVPWTDRLPTLAYFLCACLPFHFGPGLPAFDSGVLPRDSGVFLSTIKHPYFRTLLVLIPPSPLDLLNSILVPKRFHIAISTLLCRVALPFPSQPSRRQGSTLLPAPHSLWPQARSYTTSIFGSVLNHIYGLLRFSLPYPWQGILFGRGPPLNFNFFFQSCDSRYYCGAANAEHPLIPSFLWPCPFSICVAFLCPRELVHSVSNGPLFFFAQSIIVRVKRPRDNDGFAFRPLYRRPFLSFLGSPRANTCYRTEAGGCSRLF